MYELRAENAIEHGSTFRPVRLVDSVYAYLLMLVVEFDIFPAVTAFKDFENGTLLRWLRVQVEYKLDVQTEE